MQRKKLIIFFILFTLALTACGGASAESAAMPSTHPEAKVQVEVIALNHAPIRSAVDEVEALTAEYGEKVGYILYDFDTEAGKAFTEKHGIDSHTPIAIYINGEDEFEIDGVMTKFYSFPQDGGTGIVASGMWTMDDLRTVLDQETN
jgi:hypothetical protein